MVVIIIIINIIIIIITGGSRTAIDRIRKIQIFLKWIEDRDYSATKDHYDTKNYMKKSSIKYKGNKPK